jgi:hypothetical protein
VSYYAIRMNSVLALPEGRFSSTVCCAKRGTFYGVTTGYGDSCTVTVLLCHNFARTICLYVFESVKSASGVIRFVLGDRNGFVDKSCLTQRCVTER